MYYCLQPSMCLFVRFCIACSLIGEPAPLQGLLWLPRIVVACAQLAAPSGGRPALQPGVQLRLYPRSHVDEASCLARYPLHSVI